MWGRFQSLRCSRVLPTCNKHYLSVRKICPPLLGNGTSVKARADRSVVVELVFKGVLHLVHTNNEWCGLALCERWLIVQCVGGHKAPYAKNWYKSACGRRPSPIRVTAVLVRRDVQRAACNHGACAAYLAKPLASIMPGQTWRDSGHKALCPLSDVVRLSSYITE